MSEERKREEKGKERTREERTGKRERKREERKERERKREGRKREERKGKREKEKKINYIAGQSSIETDMTFKVRNAIYIYIYIIYICWIQLVFIQCSTIWLELIKFE